MNEHISSNIHHIPLNTFTHKTSNHILFHRHHINITNCTEIVKSYTQVWLGIYSNFQTACFLHSSHCLLNLLPSLTDPLVLSKDQLQRYHHYINSYKGYWKQDSFKFKILHIICVINLHYKIKWHSLCFYIC